MRCINLFSLAASKESTVESDRMWFMGDTYKYVGYTYSFFHYSVCGNGFFFSLNHVAFFIFASPYQEFHQRKGNLCNCKCHLIKTHMFSIFPPVRMHYVVSYCVRPPDVDKLYGYIRYSNLLNSQLPSTTVERKAARNRSTFYTALCLHMVLGCTMYVTLVRDTYEL